MSMEDRLIVALDVDAPNAGVIFSRLNRELGLCWFKIGMMTLLEHSGMVLIENMLRDGVQLMLDLKVFDQPDATARIVDEAFHLGARFVTVSMPSLDSAMRADQYRSPGDGKAVLAVPTLTSDLTSAENSLHVLALRVADGIVCSVSIARRLRLSIPDRVRGKIIICPGIRPLLDETSRGGSHERRNDHTIGNISTPSEAIAAGADYIVVGRPITAALDPVAAARAILDEMKGK